ncbi:hypothetical protein BsWGS_08008 [Bradybaena similaris]
MATRRHRLVIKPNIKPATPKTSATATPKPKTPINAGFESPSPGVRPQQATPLQEEIQQPPVDDGDSKKLEVIPDIEITKPRDVSGNAEFVNAKFMELELSVDADEKQSIKQQMLSPTNNGKAYTGFEEGGDGSTSMTTNISSMTMNSATPSSHHRKNLQLSATDSETLTTHSKDVTNSAEVVKLADVDGHAATPSEADSSYMSEAMSLDPDLDRQKEVSDKSEKKRKWHKTKKPRADPLPTREKSPDRQKMKMSDLLLWNPQQNFLPRKNKKKTAPTSDTRSSSPSSSVAADDDSESTNQSASLPAPQIMIGPDGSIVLNTESLLINTQREDTKPKEVLEDDDDDRYLNTNSYRKYQRTKQWTEEETDKFFMGLSMCGTDFSLLTNLLPNRTRRELKNKFYREERRNRDLIDKALSNRQQYDLTPFENIAVEDEKKVKKQANKRMKKETSNDKKGGKTTKKRRGKKKNKESEDEEDDWGEEYNEEDEENQNMGIGNEESAESPFAKNKSKVQKVKTEATKQRKSKLADQNTKEITANQVPKYEDFIDLDNPRMTTKPTKTYSRSSPENRIVQQPTITPSTGGSFNASSSIIQAIPGSTQVQIEMEGVQNPVQGVLIPSHMVPQIAPQLGIHANPAGMQVLLVQEETASGSMVHVYVIPEGSTAQSPAVGGTAGPSSHPAFTSPIPSPHPSVSVQSPGAASSYHTSCNSHPLASVCSPPPKSPFHSPSPLHYPALGDPHQTTGHQPHNSSLQQNPNPQSTPATPHSEPLASQRHKIEVSLPPSHASTNMQEKFDSIQTNRDVVCVSPCSQSKGSSVSHTAAISVPPQTRDFCPSVPEATASVAHDYTSDDVVVAVQDTASRSADSSAVYNSSGGDVNYSNNLDDDCVIVDAEGSQSRFDKSAISCL